MNTAPPLSPAAVQPVVLTPDLDRLQGFHAGLPGAERTLRVPEEGPFFFVGLRIGHGEPGLVADSGIEPGTPVRILLSFAVTDVDGLLERVEPLDGTVLGPPTDMPWGQRVAHIRDPDGNAVNPTQPC